MEQKSREQSLKERIRSGHIRREDVTRRLAELAFGKANDCVRLALEDEPQLSKLDLSLQVRSNAMKKVRWRSNSSTACGRWNSCPKRQGRKGRMQRNF